jgi:two-component system, cell cycle sensor histidine kinase and response regulator CckA
MSGPVSGPRILLVDDEPPVRVVLRRALEQVGCIVYEADDGTTALDQALSLAGELDAVITDLVMPRMNGTELGARLRHLYPAVPVIYMSGYAPEAHRARGMVPPDARFIQKPVRIASLTDELLFVLAARRPRSGRASLLDAPAVRRASGANRTASTG